MYVWPVRELQKISAGWAWVALEPDNSLAISTQTVWTSLKKYIKTILTRFATVVYCLHQGNIKLNYKYLCVAVYLHVCVRFLQSLLTTTSSTPEALTKLEGFLRWLSLFSL